LYWTVPALTTDTYQIKIVDSSDPSVFKISSSVTINSSKSLSLYSLGTVCVGGVLPISWASTGAISRLKIDLYKNGTLVTAISANTPNDRYFPWLVPLSYTVGTNYQVKITDLDSTANAMSGYFSIVAAIPLNQTWGVDVGDVIEWTVGFNLVMDFPDAFWQDLNDYMFEMTGQDVDTKQWYQGFKATIPNCWHLKAIIKSKTASASGVADLIIGDLLIKENDESTYQQFGAYLKALMSSVQTTVDPLLMSMPPAVGIADDMLDNAPIARFMNSLPPGYSRIMNDLYSILSPILPTDFSFADDYETLAASMAPSVPSYYASFDEFLAGMGLSINATQRSMAASVDLVALNNSEFLGDSPYKYYGGVVGYFLSSINNMIGGGKLELTKGLGLANFTYNNTMVLDSFDLEALVEGLYIARDGSSFPFKMSVELIVNQGEETSVTYKYSDPGSIPGFPLEIIIMVGFLSCVSIVTNVLRKKRQAP
nr:Loki-CTERM sorting domain-containing protein [Candidatus Sigynarchaeota archaeon]